MTIGSPGNDESRLLAEVVAVMRFGCCWLLLVILFSNGCAKQNPAELPQPVPSHETLPALPTNLFGPPTLYEVKEQDGKLCLTTKRLTLYFEGIGVDANGTVYRSNFQLPQATSASTTATHRFGSTEVKVAQTSGNANAVNIDINGYKLRLVDEGKALEIDGTTYPFEEPHILVVAKDGTVKERQGR